MTDSEHRDAPDPRRKRMLILAGIAALIVVVVASGVAGDFVAGVRDGLSGAMH